MSHIPSYVRNTARYIANMSPDELAILAERVRNRLPAEGSILTSEVADAIQGAAQDLMTP